MFLKCPACLFDMSQVNAGEVILDVCKQGCGGIWLDQLEIRKIDLANVELRKTLEKISFDLEAMASNIEERHCPRCHATALRRQPADAQRTFAVDECPACNGLFLDYGELASLRRAAGTPEALSEAILKQLGVER